MTFPKSKSNQINHNPTTLRKKSKQKKAIKHPIRPGIKNSKEDQRQGKRSKDKDKDQTGQKSANIGSSKQTTTPRIKNNLSNPFFLLSTRPTIQSCNQTNFTPTQTIQIHTRTAQNNTSIMENAGTYAHI